MVEKKEEKGYVVCVCGECGHKYKNEKHAKECESYCKDKKECSIDIVKHAVE